MDGEDLGLIYAPSQHYLILPVNEAGEYRLPSGTGFIDTRLTGLACGTTPDTTPSWNDEGEVNTVFTQHDQTAVGVNTDAIPPSYLSNAGYVPPQFEAQPIPATYTSLPDSCGQNSFTTIADSDTIIVNSPGQVEKTEGSWYTGFLGRMNSEESQIIPGNLEFNPVPSHSPYRLEKQPAERWVNKKETVNASPIVNDSPYSPPNHSYHKLNPYWQKTSTVETRSMGFEGAGLLENLTTSSSTPSTPKTSYMLDAHGATYSPIIPQRQLVLDPLATLYRIGDSSYRPHHKRNKPRKVIGRGSVHRSKLLNDGTYMCQKCDANMPTPGAAKKHATQSMSDDDMLFFVCANHPICQKMFSGNLGLQNHLKVCPHAMSEPEEAAEAGVLCSATPYPVQEDFSVTGSN